MLVCKTIHLCLLTRQHKLYNIVQTLVIIVANNLGEPIAENNQRADVNGDGVINILDLVAVANAFE